MKKVYVALMCIATLGAFLTGCSFDPKDETKTAGAKSVADIDIETLDSVTQKCWEGIFTYYGFTEKEYYWMTEKEVVRTLQLSQEIMGDYGTYSYKENAAKDQKSCEALGGDDNFCWKVTLKDVGITVISYYWDSQKDVKGICDVLYGDGEYDMEKVEGAKDEAACDELENAQYEKSCWKYSYVRVSDQVTYTYYMWGTEDGIKRLKEVYDDDSQYSDFVYEPAAASDKASCDALED